MCLSRPLRKTTQSTINDWAGEECKFTNIEPVGDPMVARRENDGIHRMVYQNIRGTTLNSGVEIPEELDVMKELRIDTQCMSEINKPWSAGNRSVCVSNSTSSGGLPDQLRDIKLQSSGIRRLSS